MSRNKFTFLLILILVAAIFMCVSCGRKTSEGAKETDLAVGDISGFLEHQGFTRTYLLHLPYGYDGTISYPLLFAFHGGGGDGQGMERLTHLNRIADKNGFIVVYPDGLNNNWNDGRPEINPEVDDLGFVSALIDKLKGEYRIDENRIYSTGISNGGMFSYRLACHLSDRIAAVAPVAALLGENLSKTCSHPKPIPIMIIMGTEDPLVPWNGGEIKAPGRSRGWVLSEAATVSFWVRVNGCSPSPEVSYLPDHSPNDGTRVRRELYGGGRDNTDVILLVVEGGGHTWPGGLQYLGERVIGKTCRDFDASEAIWEFFSRHTLQRRF